MAIGAADRDRTCVCAVAPHGSAIELRTRDGAGAFAVASTSFGGRLRVRTPHLAVPTRFQDGLPATPAEPSVLDVSARLERAAPAFGRRCSDPLSYETKLGLELRVPVEVIHPALVQIAGWKRSLGCQQLAERRLLPRTPRFCS